VERKDIASLSLDTLPGNLHALCPLTAISWETRVAKTGMNPHKPIRAKRGILWGVNMKDGKNVAKVI
jgi:hypothetical protein